MRPARSLLAALLTLVVTGCSLLGPRAFQVTLEPQPGGGGERLPVTVTDVTGLLRGAGQAPAQVSDGIVPVPGRSDAVIVSWIGGACDERVSMTLEGGPGAVRLVLATKVRPGDCDAIGIGRAVLLHFFMPLAPDDVDLDFER